MTEIAQGINVDPKIMGGAPVISGTRVPVKTVLEHLGAGMTADEIAQEYNVKREQVLNCVRFANNELSQMEFRAA